MALKIPTGAASARRQTGNAGATRPASAQNGHVSDAWLHGVMPSMLAHDETLVLQHIREGRFQRSLALVTAFSALMSGLEVTYEHYIGSYSERIMYTPVLLSGGLCMASVWGIFNRRAAHTILPVASALMIADGVVGFGMHVRGIKRKPGGWRLPVTNMVMGPPILAPLLLAISGFLGMITTFLRREDDPVSSRQPQAHSRHLRAVEQEIREGRFQRIMGVAAAISAFLSGFEALYSHYKNNFTYRIEWTPIILTPLVMIAGIGTIWSRMMGKVFLPITSALALLAGMVGFFYHLRGLMRRPGGLKKPFYNLLYGPPIFAPLLFSATGFLGLLAGLLRRAKR